MVCELDGPTPILKRSNVLVTKTDSPAAPDGPAGPPWQAERPAAPFVLLDDCSEGGSGLFYGWPSEIVETRDPAEVPACLDRLRGTGLHAAGFLSYEAGHALEPKLAPLCRSPGPDEPPLLWFGLFDHCHRLDARAVLPDPAGAWAGRARPLVERSAYEEAVAAAKADIEAGNIYQANITFPAEVRIAGSPPALYAAIRARARAGHGALVFTGAHWLLSFSPELFFTLESGRLTARPMKGTAARGARQAQDEAAAAALREDPKQRAENLMIVDLLRNDLSRVARPGSVRVPELFAVETYPTVHQMTSTVTAELEEKLDAVDVLRAIFPCGSITGAPKIRAMEIIAGLERRPRGIYTGAIGRLAPDGDASFNVAIRTLVLSPGSGLASLGLGAGIVADSVASAEWRECLTKGMFVETGRRFDLVETMRFDPDEGVADLERHLARMKASSEALDFAFDRHHVRNELQAATFRLRAAARLRLLLSRTGAIAIECRPMPEPPAEPVRVSLAALPVASDDFRLRHKTRDRGYYDDARKACGAFETLFTDPDGFLTEGSFTSLFVQRGGTLLTPPLSRGLLPGVLRARLIEEGKAEEADLVPADLDGDFLIGNALRGLIRATL
jgi:para-aminobenzoate synthetase/4-amino-4-deoxychorismate lyase